MSDDFVAEYESLEPKLRHAVKRMLFVLPFVESLIEFVHNVPAITGSLKDEPANTLRVRLDVEKLVRDGDELPDDCHAAIVPYIRNLADWTVLHDAQLRMLDKICDAIVKALDEACSDSAHQFARRFIESRLVADETSEIRTRRDEDFAYNASFATIVSRGKVSGNTDLSDAERAEVLAAVELLVTVPSDELQFGDYELLHKLLTDYGEMDGASQNADQDASGQQLGNLDADQVEQLPPPPVPVALVHEHHAPGESAVADESRANLDPAGMDSDPAVAAELAKVETDRFVAALAAAADAGQRGQMYGLATGEPLPRKPATGLPMDSMADRQDVDETEPAAVADDLDVDERDGEVARTIRRYQMAVGALCAAAALILVVFGTITYSAQEQADRADARTVQAIEKARTAPVVVEITGEGIQGIWRLVPNKPIERNGVTMTVWGEEP